MLMIFELCGIVEYRFYIHENLEMHQSFPYCKLRILLSERVRVAGSEAVRDQSVQCRYPCNFPATWPSKLQPSQANRRPLAGPIGRQPPLIGYAAYVTSFLGAIDRFQ
jgi:hypothetical protein